MLARHSSRNNDGGGKGIQRSDSVYRDMVTILLVIILLASLFPLFVMILLSLRSGGGLIRGLADIIPREITLENYSNLLRSRVFLRYFLNSSIVAAFVVIGNVFLASMAGYGIARGKSRYSKAMLFPVIGTMMLPKHILMVPLFTLMLKLRLLDTYPALVLPFVIDAFNVFFVYQYLKALPIEYEQAASIDGAGLITTFFKIILPVIKPALVVVAMNTFLINWNSFLLPFVLTSRDQIRTLPVGLAILSQGEHSTNWALLMAGSVLASVPTLFLFGIGARKMQRFGIEALQKAG
ncbi:MAG: carbohydrate ABC transporter permease [bacterium]